MARWFRRSKKVRKMPQQPGDARRFKRLPEQVDLRKTRTSHPASPPRDPEGGRDTDRDFIIRYGDPFDDA
ncbi:MAG TPA: hypothetical protein VE441_06335 [Mycobacterium sp.]|nr:hypothetical protein [Mycobacterium sp.]